MYYDRVLAILRKHNVNDNGRTRIKDIWKVLHEKNLTDDGKERKTMIVEKVLFKDNADHVDHALLSSHSAPSKELRGPIS